MVKQRGVKAGSIHSLKPCWRPLQARTWLSELTVGCRLKDLFEVIHSVSISA